jgi:hypothetical protein
MLVAGPPQNSRSVQVAPVIAVAGDRRHIGGYVRAAYWAAITVRDGSRSAFSAGRSHQGYHASGRSSMAETLGGEACQQLGVRRE